MPFVYLWRSETFVIERRGSASGSGRYAVLFPRIVAFLEMPVLLHDAQPNKLQR